VWHTLSDLCHRHLSDAQLSNQVRAGFTTVEVADLLALDRANTSRDLNQLVDEGRVVKLSGKPVLYLDRSFLEEKLGEPLNPKQSRLSNLLTLQHKTQSSVTHGANGASNSSANGGSQAHRAVRWLDLPDEGDIVAPQTVPLQPYFYHLGVIVIAHGRSTASSMTEAACKLASVNGECTGGLALDVELDSNFDWITNQAETLVRTSASTNQDGVLLLVDLPQLTALESTLAARTGYKLQTVENVNTAMLVEALRCANTGCYTLEALVQHLHHQLSNSE
jgi:hypothetical protein